MADRPNKFVLLDADQFLEYARDLLTEAAELAVKKAHEAHVRDNLRPYDAAVNGEELLTRKQAAKVLGVSVSTIDTLRRDDHLPVTLIGTSPRFSRADLQDYIRKQKTGGQ